MTNLDLITTVPRNTILVINSIYVIIVDELTLNVRSAPDADYATMQPVPMCRCVFQWELSGACAGESKSQEGLKDVAEAVAEEESDGYVLDMRDGSDLDRGSDFEAAAEERRASVGAMAQ